MTSRPIYPSGASPVDIYFMQRLDSVMSPSGSGRSDRTGVGTQSAFGRLEWYPLTSQYVDGVLQVSNFPLLRVKKTAWRWAFEEMFWFLSGKCDSVRPLQAKGITIWDEWATADGSLGPVYGVQWRNFNGIDQIAKLVHNLEHDPYSRRHVVSAWNPEVLPRADLSPADNASLGYMALAPCHYEFQCYVVEKAYDLGTAKYLSLKVNLRSSDTCLGSPFNIAQYAMLLSLLSYHLGMLPDSLLVEYGDYHIYKDHVPFLPVMESQFAALNTTDSTVLTVGKASGVKDTLFDYGIEDLDLSGYNPQPKIDLPIAV